MDVRAYNQQAWDHEVTQGCVWTVPVDSDTIARARQGDWHIVLTPLKPIPSDWFPADLSGLDVLCLASGGGQQGPVLAAAGANVTVYDNSPNQLAQDRLVAEREGLTIRTVQGDMRDLSCFEHSSFDLIIHPVSNLFVPDVLPVWQEASRVLRPGGSLLAGVANPLLYIFDMKAMDDENRLEVRHSIPYSDTQSLSETERQDLVDQQVPLCFGHTLYDLIQGQIDAGLLIAGFYEDKGAGVLDNFIDAFIATRAIKPHIE